MNIKKKQPTFNQESFKVFDSKTMPYEKNNASAHFALTDALITYAGANEQPVLHFWQTPPLAILGMMDTRISHFEQALSVFDAYDHDVVIRNSGGLAVVSDPGVLNVSLIYPSNENRLTINTGYEFMLDFIRKTFYPLFPYEIKAYEITNSYCFGDFDLSIEGKKIAGISQRRIKDGVAIMLYISVNGDQEQRAEMLKKFYDIGLDGSEPAGRYPDIHPEVMTTLEEAYETTLSVDEVKSRMLSHFDWSLGVYSEEIDGYYSEALEKMYRRNRRVFGEDFV
ncbi:MAG TPA: lipoate--protein ligase family protein [Atopostipes sp.]|nr:lipoate--protein ligase family protein [Atopostipes sp.]